MNATASPLRDGPAVVGICLLALAVRFTFHAISPPRPWPDSVTYLASSVSLLESGRIPSDRVMPLYPALLALTGPEYALICQIVISAGTALIAYYLAHEIFDSLAAARCAGVLMALDPVTTFYANQRLTETLVTFLLSLALLVLFRRRCFWGSFLFVTSLLVRPTMDLFGPVLVLHFSLFDDGRLSLRRACSCLGTYCLVYVALMSPWWWHNSQKYGRFVRLNLGSGLVLRVEHNPIFQEFGFDWARLRPVITEFDHITDPVRRDSLYSKAAIRYIKEDLSRYVYLCFRRLGRFWSPVLDQSDPFLFSRTFRFLTILSTTTVYVGLVITLTRSSPRLLISMLPILTLVLYLTAVHTASHALVRYRVPLTPVLVALSSGFWQHVVIGFLRTCKSRHNSRDRLQT